MSQPQSNPDGWHKHASYVALERPEYLFELDEFRNKAGDQMLFVHLWVKQWSAPVFRRIVSEWRIFRSIVSVPLFAFGEEDDEKWARFVSLLGFKPLTEIPCECGETRRLFISLPIPDTDPTHAVHDATKTNADLIV